MIRILIVALALFFSACSHKTVQPNEKAFGAEDTYIVFALRAEQVGDYRAATKLFYELYQKSSKKEYLYRYLQDKLVLKEYDDVIKTVDDMTDGSLDDPKLIRLKIIALLESNALQEAKKVSIELARFTHKPEDYLLVSDVYTKSKDYDLALKYLEGAYMKEYNEKILDKIAVILYVNLNRKKEAIAELESHARIHGCSDLICTRLASFYSHDNNIDGLLSVYKRIYAKNKSEDIAQKIIQIYSYKREYVKLIDFLEENKLDDELLLQLYVTGKDYKRASKLAFKLYKENSDVAYLGQSAIYKYESYHGKVPKKVLYNVIANLENVVKKNKDTLYMNYLGYILIDHDVNVKKGMRYIREVLKKQPNSAYYLDSLAWGYYKLGRCQKAKKIMLRVVKLEGGDVPEVKEHLKKINRCIQKHKRVKKKK
jgi:predicted Zn-dependent protease